MMFFGGVKLVVLGFSVLVILVCIKLVMLFLLFLVLNLLVSLLILIWDGFRFNLVSVLRIGKVFDMFN